MRNVCFILGIIFLKLVNSDLNNQSIYNILRYLQSYENNSTDNTDDSSEPISNNGGNTNPPPIENNSITSSTTNSGTSSNSKTSGSATTNITDDTNSNTTDNIPANTTTDNTPDNNSSNTNNDSTSKAGGTKNVDINARYNYLKKDYDSWEDFFDNIVYDNSFSYPSNITQEETTDTETQTDTQSTTTNLGRQRKAKYKSDTGSFLDDLKNRELELNITNPSKNIKLRMAIAVSRPGLFRPEANLIGEYQPIVQSSSSISTVRNEPKDILGMRWDPRFLISDKGFKYAQRFANQSINLYKSLKLSNFTNINETDFVSVERNVSITYTQKVFQDFFKEFKNAIIESTDYTDEKLDKFLFTNKIGSKTIGYLLKDYNHLYFGFGYKTCPKFISWMNRAEDDKFLKTVYQTKFEKTLNSLVDYFKDKQSFYLFNTDIKVFNFSKDQIFTNFSLTSTIIEAFYSNYVNSMGNEENLNQLYKIIPKDIVQSELFAIKSFFQYEYILYSHMHTYLLVSPLYERIFTEFNKAIKDSKYTRKYLYYTASEHVLSAIFKLFYFKYPDYVRTNDDYNLKAEEMLSKKMIYNDCPFIDFGYNIAFELWESQDRTHKTYYFGFRQNNNPSLTFLMTGETFLEAMKLFYLNPTMTVDERRFWCR
jgi:hypothetical protein